MNRYPNKTKAITFDSIVVMNINKEPLIDFLDPGMHSVFLVEDIKKFVKCLRLEENDIELSFGLKYDEWLSILIEAFNIDKNFDEINKKSLLEKKILLTLNNELPFFPLFSRIKSFIADAAFDKGEISFLKIECNQLLDTVKNKKSRRGIEKMIMICDWAIASSKNIYFLGN